MTGRRLRPEEQRLWERIAATVTPIEPRQHPGEGFDFADREGGAATGSGALRIPPVVSEGPAPAKRASPPAQVDGHKRVRRGAFDIDGRIDLHGFTREQARAALTRVVARVQSDGGRCVLVITGKGRTDDHLSDDPGPHGVLRRALPEWLAQPDLACRVSGYAPAHRRHGGSGAWYVFLRRLGQL